MDARTKIFTKLNKFQSDEILTINSFENDTVNLIETFIKNAQLAGAKIYSTKEEIEAFYTIKFDDSFTYHSTLGVAENGALWCSDLENKRAKLFASNDLIITISKNDIVLNMHQAYETISLQNITFGVFIAGPSKTADIEQSLVIGAHGAMGFHILLLD